MKNGETFYSVSVWAHWNNPVPTESDFADYNTISDSVHTIEGVHNIVNGYKAANNMDGEGYDHFFSIAECVADDELEGGYDLINSMSYEEWADNG